MTTGLAVTTCTSGNCTGIPFPIASDWISLFVQKNASFDPTTLTRSTYDDVFHASKQEFTSIINTADPDLSSFRDAGGKVITWHGMSDQLIFPEGTADYFNRVEAMDPGVTSYYRHFRAPGIQHCGDGLGAYPGSTFESLVQWVENGVEPNVLAGESLPLNGTVIQRNLCLYPQDPIYTGGDPNVASSFQCIEPKVGTEAPGLG
jgi:feruloyl esterase